MLFSGGFYGFSTKYQVCGHGAYRTLEIKSLMFVLDGEDPRTDWLELAGDIRRGLE